MDEMQIIIENDGLNGISNYEPLKAWATEQVAVYKGLIVQEDAIAPAKADCAKLRKIAKAASDYRIQIKKAHEAKIAKTVEQLKEITNIFNDAAESIDNQVKAFDERRKEEKRTAILDAYEDVVGSQQGIMPLAKVYNEKWMNKGYDIPSIKKEIAEKFDAVQRGIETIKGMCVPHETEMISAFLERFDLSDALARKNQIEALERQIAEKEEAAKKQAEEEAAAKQEAQEEAVPEEETIVPPEPTYDLTFVVRGTRAQLIGLQKYLKDNGIKYKRG